MSRDKNIQAPLCQSCGASLQIEITETVWRCEHCGTVHRLETAIVPIAQTTFQESGIELVDLAESRGEDMYGRWIRGAVRGYWVAAMDYDQYHDAMRSAIDRGFPRAWAEGAKECGIKPDEYKPEERIRLQQRIVYEYQWIAGYGEAIEADSKANGGLLRPLLNRSKIWTGRYVGVVSEARAMACADRKLEWVLGPAEHCPSCLKLAGKVKRGSYWNERGILPRIHDAPYLDCGGWRCQCSLEPTDEPLSKGPLPRLP